MISRVAIVLVAGLALAGCTSSGHRPATSSAARATSSAPPASTSPAPSPPPRLARPDAAACASLFTRLQQVSAVLNASSELIANSADKSELGQHIADEQQQLSRSADLMAQPPLPDAVRDADRRLVAALRTLTADFGRAAAPAARGDFQAATAAMRDDATVQHIVDASKAIEDACG